jgi:hypothetical protein
VDQFPVDLHICHPKAIKVGDVPLTAWMNSTEYNSELLFFYYNKNTPETSTTVLVTTDFMHVLGDFVHLAPFTNERKSLLYDVYFASTVN